MSWSKRPALEAPHDGGDGGRKNMDSALTMPTGIDPDWRERIDLAKRAHEEGKKLRQGKPITFRMSQPLSLGDGPNA